MQGLFAAMQQIRRPILKDRGEQLTKIAQLAG
jgi:hypothetical protein